MSALPNIISASRGVAALAMLLFPVFSPGFWLLYGWGGVSDMVDGPIARRLGVAGVTGSRIDSVADLLLVTCSAIMILPSVDLPRWVWMAAIGVAKLTGILLFCLPFAIVRLGALIPAVVACSMATTSLLEDFHTAHDARDASPW